MEGFLAAFASAAEAVEISFLWRPQLQDPADELVLETEVHGRAQALVTHNVADFRRAFTRFGIRTVKPADFLEELES